MVVVDGVARLIPGVLGAPDGAGSDSFSTGAQGGERLLEGPQYTRPREFRGMKVPDILLSGDHAAVAAWRRGQARQRTGERRPDLLAGPSETHEKRSHGAAPGAAENALVRESCS
jgi:tRNA (guanine37-N1)-methyltransferase